MVGTKKTIHRGMQDILETETAHIELGNLNVLLRALHQTSQPGLTRQQIPFVLQMLQLVQPMLAPRIRHG